MDWRRQRVGSVIRLGFRCVHIHLVFGIPPLARSYKAVSRSCYSPGRFGRGLGTRLVASSEGKNKENWQKWTR